MSRRLVLACVSALALAAGCAEAPAGDTGTVRAAFGFDGPQHDVAAFEVRVVAAPGTCADEALATQVVPVEAEMLPAWLEPDPPGGDMHPFGDALFVLQPGDYHVCATPLTAAGVPTEHCAPVEGDATVVAEQTTEIVLFSQCLGDPTGGLDVVTALNDPPHIDGLVIDESKFIDVCTPATVTVSASDPNGDALTYAWAVTGAPDGGAGTITGEVAEVAFAADVPGEYQVTVTVSDGHGGTATLSFPVHVSDAECDTGCDLGTATSSATADDPSLFGSVVPFAGGADLPPGEYQIEYVDGCFKFSPQQWWAIHARLDGFFTWWLVGATSAEQYVFLPGTEGFLPGTAGPTGDKNGFEDFEDCVAANLALPPVTFNHTGGPLSIWLADGNYPDNQPGLDGRNPTWRLTWLDCQP